MTDNTVSVYGHEVELPVPEGMVVNVMILARVIDPEHMRQGNIVIASDDSTDSILEQGMLSVAHSILSQEWMTDDDEE